MIELFRYIEQAFAIPGDDDSIDVTTDSDFQQGLQDAIADGADASAIRGRASEFLDSALDGQGVNPLPRSTQYLDLRRRLRALSSPSPASVKSEIRAVFDQEPDDLVNSDAFKAESILASDLIVATKLTTAFDRLDAAGLAETRRVIAFLVDLVDGEIDSLTANGIRERLARPLKIPQVFLPKAGPSGPPVEPPSHPDAETTRRQALLKEQAKLQNAYETLMRLHPSQLEVHSPTRPGPEPVRSAAATRESSEQSTPAAARSILAVPTQTIERLDPLVRSVIHSQLSEGPPSLTNVVDVVKRRWLEVSNEVGPYTLPKPARTYRVGMHLFAVDEAAGLADVRPTEPVVAPDFSHAVTRPVGVGNLQVVRQQLVGYEAADISHIENVMPGELLRRVTRREETSELIVTDETETTQIEERDLQSTQRNELATEAQKEASQQTVSTQDQTTTTNYGRLVENSKTNYARSVTDRAVNKVTQMVRQQRVRRESKTFSDRALHELDNKDGNEGIRGIYQWVDKKYNTRILNYGKRLLYDVVVPEPAAFLIDSLKSAAQPENFQLIRPTEPRIRPYDLNAGNYMDWAVAYGVTGSVSPPPEDFVVTVAHTDAQNVDKKVQAYGQSLDAQVYQAFEIQIPENYKAISGYVQQPGWTYLGTPGMLEFCIGEYYRIQYDPNTPYRISFAMNGESGRLPVTLRSQARMLQFTYGIGIHCQRMDKALEQWQLKTHAAIMSGYQRQRAEYLDQLNRYQAAVRTQMALAHNFARDSSVERTELKRLFIHLLVSEHLSTVGLPTPIHNQFWFLTDPNYVKKWGAVVAFFERAFEWENMMYVYYPYFYGRLARWGELILIQDLDPEFEAFLKAGAARVVVPARPGFEAALAHYHETGDVWMGEEMPDMFSDMYVSIIAEIKARNAKPDEEVCVAEWEVRLPTTLVILKNDDTLPQWKPAKDCIPPPEP